MHLRLALGRLVMREPFGWRGSRLTCSALRRLPHHFTGVGASRLTVKLGDLNSVAISRSWASQDKRPSGQVYELAS